MQFSPAGGIRGHQRSWKHEKPLAHPKGFEGKEAPVARHAFGL